MGDSSGNGNSSSSSSSSPSPSPSPSSSSTSSNKIQSPVTNLSSYLVQLQSSLQPPTRNAASIPNPSDLSFHRSLDRKLATSIDAESNRLLNLIDHVAAWASKEEKAGSKSNGKGRAHAQHSHSGSDSEPEGQAEGGKLIGEDELSREGFSSSIGDLVDQLLEQSDVCLDEFSGLVAPRSKSLPSLQSAVAAAKKPNFSSTTNSLPTNGPLPPSILNAQIQPPQLSFTTKPDNTPGKPWSRTLKLGKPNSIIPLGEKPPDINGSIDYQFNKPKWGMYSTEGDPRENPYHFEIYKSTPPEYVFEKPNPIRPLDMDPNQPTISTEEQPFKWVDSKKDLEELLTHLKEDRVREIAIDLEHHNYRTFQGITCLMQLSTRWGDWIIDTLSDQVREHAEMLNVVMTDVNKIKILHGADHDILWLQRDLGIYIVNLFDTYHSTNVLDFPAHGLAFLLARYLGFEADKRYQLADWRLRPLPKEMVYYARSDTHSLIYIYDCLRDELLNQGGKAAIKEVFDRSKNTATKMYSKEEWDESGSSREGWKTIWKKFGGESSKGIDNRSLKQMGKEERLVRILHKWRDQVARELDESPRYVLSVKNLLLLASRAPTNSGEALACLTPGVPALRKRAPELARVIKEEISAWEKDSREEEARRRQELEAGASAMEGVESTAAELGEKIERSPNTLESFQSQSPASTSTSLFPSIVSSLWSALKGQAPETPAAQPNAAAAPPVSNARALASSLFGGNKSKRTPAPRPADSASNPSDASLAKFIASSSSLLGNKDSLAKATASSTPLKPSLFTMPTQPQQDSNQQNRSKVQSRLSNIQDSLEGSLRASLGSTIFGEKNQVSKDDDVKMKDMTLTYSSSSTSSDLLSQPENVAFVPKSQRNEVNQNQLNQASTLDSQKQKPNREENPIQIPSSSFIKNDESMSSIQPDRERSNSDSQEEGDESEIVQVGKKKRKKTKKEKEKKPRWSKEEKKRKRDESQRADPEGESLDDPSESNAKKARRRKVDPPSSSTSSPISEQNSSSQNQPFVPFDYSSSVSVLDTPAPSSALSKNKKKKDRKDKDKSKGNGKGKGKEQSKNADQKTQSHSHERIANGPQPRKKNEMNSGNKSFTFGH